MTDVYNIAIVGNSGVGKTTLVSALIGLEYDFLQEQKQDYVEIPVTLSKNFILHLRDPVKPIVDNSEFWNSVDGVIIMYDMRNEKSKVLSDVSGWIGTIEEKRGNIPIVVCGNFVCTGKILIELNMDCEIHQERIQYCSGETNWKKGINLPFLLLVQALKKDPELTFETDDQRDSDSDDEDPIVEDLPTEKELAESKQKMYNAITAYFDLRSHLPPVNVASELVRMVMDVAEE